MKLKLENIKVGSLVAFNLLEDATWFEVLKIDGFNLEVKPTDVPEPASSQMIDRCYVKQVKNP